MELSPDQSIIWEYGIISINLTLVTTWGIMLLLVISSALISRKLKTGVQISRWQCTLEIIVMGINKQIKEVGIEKPEKYIGFIGTLFLFILVSNVLIIIPWYSPPTGSLSTTGALAISVLLAVPYFGIAESGMKAYLKSYLSPSFIMLPFNIIGEISRTIALTIRLFGNIMSGGLIVAILLSVAPFIFPIIMTALGLLTGVVQAYIFSILATVYIAAAVSEKRKNSNKKTEEVTNG